MRTLVACSECRRQYDASGRSPGTRFRCRCGVVVTIEEPKAHESSVVRCSSCGAPREERSANCRFCGADFTLHERDLNTICPHCMARVSNRARFCHHCGIELAPEAVAGKATKLTCPVCGGDYHLSDRRIGDVHVLECPRCAGLWLSDETFNQLTKRAKSDAPGMEELFDLSPPRRPKSGPQDEPEQSGWRYRNCPVCDSMMNRRNFGRRSGVIIDICKDHGIWFDADELRQILSWIRSGGLAKAEEEQAQREAHDERMKRLTETRSERGAAMGAPLGEPGGYTHHGPLGGFLDEIIDWFMRPP
jgi:Zn-finger nucleic acid-binding protein